MFTFAVPQGVVSSLGSLALMMRDLEFLPALSEHQLLQSKELQGSKQQQQPEQQQQREEPQHQRQQWPEQLKRTVQPGPTTQREPLQPQSNKSELGGVDCKQRARSSDDTAT